MRASRPHDHNSHCFRCYMRREICICPILPTVQTQTEVLILRHIQEAERPSNTGRLVALAMPNSQILSCGGGDRLGLSSLDEELLRSPGTWLLWPDGTSSSSDMLDAMPPERLVVLDATWRQARRLYSRMPVLRTMPRLALPAPAQHRNRLRDQHRSDGMSTIEAVAAAVAKLEGTEMAEPLEMLYDEVVRRTFTRRWGVKKS
ncbi:MAG: tRNA-uridine aminocarboxypropyltransferase [Smithella sp.]|nr:DTW domain-containing protein [Syntrophaceae bacterium]NTW77772.1 DTW domain-containing protein [Syntrophaceae bacterium]